MVLILPPTMLLVAEISPAVERLPTARLPLIFELVLPNTATFDVPFTLTVTLPFALTIFTLDVPEFMLVPAVVMPVERGFNVQVHRYQQAGTGLQHDRGF